MSRMRTPPLGWADTGMMAIHRATAQGVPSRIKFFKMEWLGLGIDHIGLTLSHTLPNQPRFWLSLTEPDPSKRRVRSANW